MKFILRFDPSEILIVTHLLRNYSGVRSIAHDELYAHFKDMEAEVKRCGYEDDPKPNFEE